MKHKEKTLNLTNVYNTWQHKLIQQYFVYIYTFISTKRSKDCQETNPLDAIVSGIFFLLITLEQNISFQFKKIYFKKKNEKRKDRAG